jgi:hypothetical protein
VTLLNDDFAALRVADKITPRLAGHFSDIKCGAGVAIAITDVG